MTLPKINIDTALISHYWNIVWSFTKANPIAIIVVVIGVPLALHFLSWFLRYLYIGHVKNVYFKVTLPREDSQKDKEKEVQKDLKEKIAIMQQCYRSLYELRGLNIMNMVRRFFFHSDIFSFEIIVEKKIINFYVVTVESYSALIEKQITSLYPSAEIEPVSPIYIKKTDTNFIKCFYVKQKEKYWFPIKTFKTIENDPLNAITNIFTKMDEDEVGGIQIIMRPAAKKIANKALKVSEAIFQGRPVDSEGNPKGSSILGFIGDLFSLAAKGKDDQKQEKGEDYYQRGMVRMIASKEDTAKRMGEKSQQSNFHVVIRMIASSSTEEKAQKMMSSMEIAINSVNDEGSNGFDTRRVIPIDFINNMYMLRNFNKRILETRIFGWGERENILSEEELATVYHFPDGKYNFTPSIMWLSYKKLPVPADMGMEGMMLGNNSYRGVIKPVVFLKKDRARHQYIIGKSGSGKSSLLSYMIRQDIKNGEGICVIDPHGDLIEDALNYVPKERVKDVVIFDAGDTDRPMGLNILEAKTPEEQDLASSQATEIFIKLFGDEIFGPRIQHYFRNACLTLMEDPDEGATLIDVPRIFVDTEFRNYKISKAKNPVVLSFWKHEYAETGDREKQEMIPYFSAKFGPFITNSIMRNTIGQPKSAFNFRECMDSGKILLVNLSKGKIGDLNTQLLGLIMVARIQMAAMSRADIPEEQRRDFYLYVDEFQNFATESFASILSEARKYHLALIMAHQYISQLVVTKTGSSNTQIRDAVFGNVGTICAFKVGAEDAEYLAKEFAPIVTEQDLVGISNYKAYVKLNINNTTSRPFSLETIWDKKGENKKIGAIVREYARMKYGRKHDFVEQEIMARIGIEAEPETPPETTEGALAATLGVEATPAPTEPQTPIVSTPEPAAPAVPTTPTQTPQ